MLNFLAIGIMPPGFISVGGAYVHDRVRSPRSPDINWERRRPKQETMKMLKIYVGNLSFNTTEDGLRDVFTEHGQVDSVAVITDRETGRSRGVRGRKIWCTITISRHKNPPDSLNPMDNSNFTKK